MQLVRSGQKTIFRPLSSHRLPMSGYATFECMPAHSGCIQTETAKADEQRRNSTVEYGGGPRSTADSVQFPLRGTWYRFECGMEWAAGRNTCEYYILFPKTIGKYTYSK